MTEHYKIPDTLHRGGFGRFDVNRQLRIKSPHSLPALIGKQLAKSKRTDKT